jgi:MYXO-CTERM domain-containing protein
VSSSSGANAAFAGFGSLALFGLLLMRRRGVR